MFLLFNVSNNINIPKYFNKVNFFHNVDLLILYVYTACANFPSLAYSADCGSGIV